MPTGGGVSAGSNCLAMASEFEAARGDVDISTKVDNGLALERGGGERIALGTSLDLLVGQQYWKGNGNAPLCLA